MAPVLSSVQTGTCTQARCSFSNLRKKKKKTISRFAQYKQCTQTHWTGEIDQKRLTKRIIAFK